jgi:hypothetical protein
MAIDFPNAPATNATYTVGNKTWIYDGATWNTYNTTSFSAETLPGTTLKSTVTGSSLTSLGTLTSLTIDGPGSSSFTLGDTGFTGYSGVVGDKGYLLVGNSVSDPSIYLRTVGGGGPVYIGQANSNTLQVGNGTVTVVGTMNATTFSGSEILATTVLAAGRGVGIKADPTDAQSILQFTNNAVSAQWSSLVATNGLLTATTPLTVTGAVSPSATNTHDLGTAALRWRNIYTQDLHLSNGIGDYTVVEGEENLYLVNNKTNKSFKFALIEVDSSEVPKLSET